MKNLLLFVFVFFFGQVLLAQEGSPPPPPPAPPPPLAPPPPPAPPSPSKLIDPAYRFVDAMPQLLFCKDEKQGKGRMDRCTERELHAYLQLNTTYPPIARENGISGRVIVHFIIEKDGMVSNVKVLRDIGGGCGEEVVRVMNSMNKQGAMWKPGSLKGKVVRVQQNVTFTFGNGVIKKESDQIFKTADEYPYLETCNIEGASKKEIKICSEKKFLEFIYKNIKYPAQAQKDGVEGMAIIQFVIEKDGSVSGAKALRKIGGGCDEEAIRVITAMNEKGMKWVPGMNAGKAVRVYKIAPIKFKLQ